MWRSFAFGLAMTLACLGARPALAAPEDALMLIGAAEALIEPDGAPAREAPVDLWRRWDKDFPGRGGHAVYRIQLPPRSGPEPMALLFSRVGNQVDIRINGNTIQHWGTLGDPSYDAAKNPLMLAVPAALLHADQPNELRVEVTVQPQRLGGLSVLRYGTLAAVEAVYDDHRRWRALALVVFAAGLVGMGALTGVLWLRQREPIYGWFCLGAALGVVRIVDRAWAGIPVPWPFLGILVASCYLAHMALMCRFALMAVGPVSRLMNRAIDAAIALSTVLTVLSFQLGVPWLLTLGIICIVPASLAALWVIVRRAWADGVTRAWVLAAALAASILAGLHDLIAVRLPGASGLQVTYLQHAMFAFVPIMAWLIATRYSRTVANFHALTADLTRRVDERERQLRAAFDALREQQHHQAVSNERQRIMREIHDGVGSQLVALLNLVARPGADAGSLREHVELALDEMRMAVDSLQPANDDLATMLATLRYRLQPRLQAAGIAVAWEVPELPELRELSPNMVAHVQRILLETFTNILKHAHASRIVVRALLHDDESAVTLQIADNGVGLAGGGTTSMPARRRGGRGLDNMRSRAAAIGAQLHVDPAPEGGVCVTLKLRVERGDPASSSPSRPLELG